MPDRLQDSVIVANVEFTSVTAIMRKYASNRDHHDKTSAHLDVYTGLLNGGVD
jgi:hypothetical protein